MNFLKLRDGCLRINVDAISNVEVTTRFLHMPCISVRLSSGEHFSLTDNDARKVLDAIDPPNMTVPEVYAALGALGVTVDTAAEMKWSEPTSAYASDLTVSHAKPGKRSGKKP